jgi:hypothetical protein
MAKFLRKTLAVLAVLMIGACIVLFMLRPAPSIGRVQIENQSGDQIKEIEISVCNNQFRFTDLPEGSVVALKYTITMDSAYKESHRKACFLEGF